MRPRDRDLVHDWNLAGEVPLPARGRVLLNDETLRDGLQSPSVRTPSLAQKLDILHGLVELGIDSADIGLPGAGPRSKISPPPARSPLGRCPSPRCRPMDQSTPPPGVIVPETWRPRCCSSAGRQGTSWTPRRTQ